jgi:SNF2 family DNA or RNA helicase
MEMLARMSRMRHITGLAKIPAAVEFAKDFIDQNERSLIIGVHHKDVGSIMFDELVKELPNVQILKLTGEMNAIDKFQVIATFNKKLSILVTSTLAGGEGVDGLQDTCNDIIMHERQWNPQNEEQLEDRLCRIGQFATSVNATYIEAEGTIDAQLDIIVETKRGFFHKAMNKGEAPQWNQSDIIKELAQSIVNRFKERNKGKEKTKSITSMASV